MIRVAVLSFWHVHAWDYTEQALANPDVEVVAVWDEDPTRGVVEAAKLEVPFIANLDELLARSDVDAVIVVAPTRLHRDVLVAAAAAGKHIFTEKVIAPTVGEVDDVIAAVRAAGVVLTVSLPFLTRGHIETIDGLIARGELGDLTRTRVILSHDGALTDWLPEQFYDADDTLGGAMIDLGCHPMYLTRHFLGRPDTVSATYASVTGRAVEDNAVAILRYANGALGIVEAGFVTAHAPFTLEVHGTRGSALYDWASDTIRVRTADDDAWRTVDAAADATMPFDRFVEHVLQGDAYAGIDADENVALAIELTDLMDAANRSAALQSAPIALSTLRR